MIHINHFNNNYVVNNSPMECTQKKCIDRIAEDWQDLSSNAEIELLKAFTVQGQKLAFVYLCKIINDTITVIIMIIITHSEKQMN